MHFSRNIISNKLDISICPVFVKSLNIVYLKLKYTRKFFILRSYKQDNLQSNQGNSVKSRRISGNYSTGTFSFYDKEGFFFYYLPYMFIFGIKKTRLLQYIKDTPVPNHVLQEILSGETRVTGDAENVCNAMA